MRKKLAFLLFLSIHTATCFASHLVGGEFEIVHLHDNVYLFRQIQYFDVLTGNPGARDLVVQASIFRMTDDVYVGNISMNLVDEEMIEYSNPSCNDSRIVTRKQIYEATAELAPADFDDPEGYYMVWERCCRNITISNIVEPDKTGQTFYIAFPALIKDGERFVNSTPQLFQPLSDYACINQLYHADFRGFDADGDSLVYSMATPLNSTISDQQDPVPTPSPAPHAGINWAAGYNENNQVPGNDPMKISPAGALTVTPSQTGLFVFAVKVEEYRDGEKIGEVRRDFQLLVVDCPPPGHKPEAKIKAPGATVYEESIGIVNLNYGDDTCFEIIVNDKDGNENITVKAVAVNFYDSLADNISRNSGLITDPADTFKFNFCFPRCINNDAANPAIVDIFIYDDHCPQALADTVRIIANVQQPANTFPQLVSPSTDIENRHYFEGDTFSLPFRGTDADNDSLSMHIIPVDFELEGYGIAVDTITNEKGEIEYRLDWETGCLNYPLGDKSEFSLMAIVEDYDECFKSNADTAYYHITIELPPNNAPAIAINGWEKDTLLNIKIEELVNFSVKATDTDAGDEVSVRAVPVGFTLEEIGLTFPEATGTGSVQQDLPWQLFCGGVSLEEKDTFMIHFIAEDLDKCRATNADTLTVTINMQPPQNNSPVITVDGQVDPDTLFYQVGQKIVLNIASSDVDMDSVSLALAGADSVSDLLGLSFAPMAGISFAEGALTWTPQCEHLNSNFSNATYTFTVVSKDNKCYAPETGEEEITIVVQDIFEDYDFLPPNAFTPNVEDDINRYYYMPELPADNCASQFKEIVIFNRWGKEVFRSDNRDFKWTGADNATGVYYYSVVYSHKTFKGIINLIK